MSNEMMEMLKAIREAQEVTNAKLESMDKRIESVEEKISSLEKRFNSLESRMGKGFAEVNERLERVEQSQARSEAVMERLSYRSIEQESEINALKKAR